MCTHQAHWRNIFAKYLILATFSRFLIFWAEAHFCFNYIYLSMCAGALIFMFWGLIHICYETINPESWYKYHDTWVAFLLNIHKNHFSFSEISKNRSAEISAIEYMTPQEGPELFLFLGGYTTLVLIKNKRISESDIFYMWIAFSFSYCKFCVFFHNFLA